MGNDMSLSRSSSKQNTKQSKKWRISSKRHQHERQYVSDSKMSESSVISWNCHHKLKDIEKNLIKHRSNFDKIKAQISTKQRHHLSMELDNITNGVTQTIHGITHNYLDGVANERALLDFWINNKIRCNDDDNDEICVIVFEIGSMDKIHNTLGWCSGDNIIIETGQKIDEYCRWYSNDYGFTFKLFHPDFALNEFIVISTCTDDRVIEDLCDCLLVDIARSVKCFFRQTTVWAGFATNSKENKKEKEVDDIRYNFRSWYERAKCAIRDAKKAAMFSEEASDRIRKWLSPKQKLRKGAAVSHIIHSFYNSKTMDINKAMQDIDHEMRNGADLNYSDKVGNTPFFYAIATKNNKLMKYLLKYEFNVDHKDRSGLTVLMQALRHNISESICCILAERLKYPNLPDNNNVTPFVWALNGGYFRVMDILKSKGSIDFRNWIISCCVEDQEIALCDAVRDNGIIFSSQLDDIGRSVLHYAVLHKAHRIIDICLKNRYIHPDVVDNNGWSPLHYAAAKNYLKSISLLIKYDANMFLKTEEDYLPINIAIKFKKKEAESLLNRYEMRTERFNKNRLSISNELNAEESKESDWHDIYHENDEWDKENQDPNIVESRTRGNSDSQSKTQSQSNSENVYKTYKAYKVPNISVIDEDVFVNKVFDEDDSDSEKSESNQTRIIHESFSDESEDDEKEEIVMNSSSNEWDGNHLNKKCLDRVEMKLISSPN